MLNRIEISKENLFHNLKIIKKNLSKNSSMMLVVKANAYGHGLKEIVELTKNSKIVGSYGVHSIEEALKVRKYNSSKTIYTLGYIEKAALKELIGRKIIPIVFNLSTIEELEELGKKHSTKIPFHLKIETGTGRQGITKKEWDKYKNKIRSLKYAYLDGISSHFANIEDTTEHSYAEYQLKNFYNFVKEIENEGFKNLKKHFSCSASTLLFPKTHFDIARVGISAYGYWPSKETKLSYMKAFGKEIELKPVLSFYSKVTQIKKLEKGSFIGYGLTYRATTDIKIAIIPAGYSDGIDRKLSNIGYFLIKGERAPIRGRVCMNITIIDVTHIKNLKLEEKVTLLGQDGKENLTADTWAEWANTINYEIIARLSPLIKRSVI